MALESRRIAGPTACHRGGQALLALVACGVLSVPVVGPPAAGAVPMAQWDRITNPPPARSNPGMTFDSRRNRVLVFGGCKRFGSISDLWSLDLPPGGGWTELSPWWEGPPYDACYRRAAVYDSLEDRVLIVHPGVYYGGPGDTLAIYSYSFSGTPGWRRLETSGSGPTRPSSWPIAILDPGERRLVLIYEQVWALSLDGPLTWTRLSPGGTAPRLTGMAAAFDAPHRRLLVNGGGPFGGAPFSTATWALDLSGSTRWDSLPVAPIPSGRRDHAAIYDTRRNRLVVAGGYGGTELLDAWALDFATGNWSEVAPSDPQFSKRYSAGAVYDPQQDCMVIFGGSDWSNEVVATVRLSFDPPGWMDDPPCAEPVHNASMVYDDVRRRMLLFGGLGPEENARDRLYALDMTVAPPRWGRVLVPDPRPVRRYAHMVAWDPVRHRMFLFGGQVDATLLNDLWFYSEDPSPQWTPVATPGSVPSPRASGALAYDVTRDRLILMGGRTDLLDVWELPLSGPTSFQWRMLAPGGATPPTRRSMGLLYDSARDRMLVIGGKDAGINVQNSFALQFAVTGDGTWMSLANSVGTSYSAVTMLRRDSVVVYDAQTAPSPFETKYLPLAGPPVWGTISVSTAPPPYRLDECGAYDQPGDRLVVFGGQQMPYSNSERRWLADTWMLSWIDPSTVDAPRIPSPGLTYLGPPIPNPARDEITVAYSRSRAGAGRLEVLDVRGRRVMQQRLDRDQLLGTTVLRLDPRLPSGLYFVRLVSERGSVTQRFSIIR